MRAPAVVADLDCEPVVVLASTLTLMDAARALAADDTGVALVADRPARALTERDVVALGGEGIAPETALGRLELRPPCFVRPDVSIEDAMTMMVVTRRRAAIVADEQQALGVIRLADAIGALLSSSTWVGALRLALHIEQES